VPALPEPEAVTTSPSPADSAPSVDAPLPLPGPDLALLDPLVHRVRFRFSCIAAALSRFVCAEHAVVATRAMHAPQTVGEGRPRKAPSCWKRGRKVTEPLHTHSHTDTHTCCHRSLPLGFEPPASLAFFLPFFPGVPSGPA
jgi:hypothetical protein